MDEKATSDAGVKIGGIGTHKIDIDMLDDSVRERVIDCIRKNGRISIQLGAGVAAAGGTKGFEQLVD